MRREKPIVRSRGASLVEVVAVVALVALAAMAGFATFGSQIRDLAVRFGQNVLHLEANVPGAVATGGTATKSFQTTGDKSGPTCDAVRGCGGQAAPATATADLAARPASTARADSIIRGLLERPDGERAGVLSALPAQDFSAVSARMGTLQPSLLALKSTNDPAYRAFTEASAKLASAQSGVLSGLWNRSAIDAAAAAKGQALAALLARAGQEIDLGHVTTAATPGGGSGTFSEFYELEGRLQVAPDFTIPDNPRPYGLPGLSALTPAERARTWEIQRSRDAEGAAQKAFGDYVMTQSSETRHAVADAQQQFLASVRAELPPSARAEFDTFFVARTSVVDGKPVIGLVPTEAARRLQDAQASLLGAVVDGYRPTTRTVPFDAPANGDEAFAWWLRFGSLDPRALAEKWAPPPDESIETADGVFALLPVGTGVVVVKTLGTMAIRQIAAAAAKEVAVNVLVQVGSTVAAEKFGPLAGTGVSVAAMVGSILSHRFPRAPKVVEAAENFGGCFVAGTLVTTEEGPIPIEQVAVGTRVLTRDVLTKEVTFAPVTHTFIKHDKPIVRLAVERDGVVESIGTTEEHPFWVDGEGWTKASELVLGQRLATAEGALTVRALSMEREPRDVFNFEVERTHTYFVGRLHAWVHNVCWARPPNGLDGDHILNGEVKVSAGGTPRATGFHHESEASAKFARIIRGSESRPDGQGVYTAKVEIKDLTTGRWIPKADRSTFFPASWERSDVRAAILEAYANRVAPRDARQWTGMTRSGVKITGYVDERGQIITAFPVPLN